MRRTRNKNQPQQQLQRRPKAPTLSGFHPVLPYRFTFRIVVEPGTAANSITGLTASNIGKAITTQIKNRNTYQLPANAVLAPTGVDAIFKYVKFYRADLWGPTGGQARIYVNSDASALSYPQMTTYSESASVTNRPHDFIILTQPFPMVIDTATTATTELFIVEFTQSAIPASDNTVVLQFQCVLYG